MSKQRLVLIALCLIGSVVFGFILPGYLCIGMLCFGVAALLVVYHLLRSHKRGRQVLTMVLILCMVCLLVVEIPIIRASFGAPDTEVDYLIVLGAQVRGTTPSRSLMDRLTAAKDYLDLHPDTIAIVSGGQGPGEEITEAQAMYDWLTEQGIAPERVWMETEAETTLENLEFSVGMIESSGGTPGRIGVVSSEYHLYRAAYLAEHNLGLAAVGVPAHTTYPLMKVNYFLREAAAVFLLWLQG